jgi:hypothetical protein
MSGWFGQMKGDLNITDPPDDIEITALLDSATILDTKNGPRFKTEWWSTDRKHWWQSWVRLDGDPRDLQRARETMHALLEGIGVDINSVASESRLADELAACEDHEYNVITSSRPGAKGAFITTTVIGLAAEVPINTNGLPPASTPAGPASLDSSALFGDEAPF